jgi:hypothetical protein
MLTKAKSSQLSVLAAAVLGSLLVFTGGPARPVPALGGLRTNLKFRHR